jgi:hypothetical protein
MPLSLLQDLVKKRGLSEKALATLGHFRKDGDRRVSGLAGLSIFFDSKGVMRNTASNPLLPDRSQQDRLTLGRGAQAAASHER